MTGGFGMPGRGHAVVAVVRAGRYGPATFLGAMPVRGVLSLRNTPGQSRSDWARYRRRYPCSSFQAISISAVRSCGERHQST